MHKVIQDIQKSGEVVGQSGRIHKLHSQIGEQEGLFLYNIIKDDPDVQKTLEVGCAYGMSSMHICHAMRGRSEASHTILDPYQNTQWDGAGLCNLTKMEIEFFEHFETKSEIYLPGILEEKRGQFDLIFIDGYHTFDQTIVECFYATQLLRTGGYLVLDDTAMPAVKRATDFIKNYPCYMVFSTVGRPASRSSAKKLFRLLVSVIPDRIWSSLLARPVYRRIFDDQWTTMVALKKISKDERPWDWHDDKF